jgi:hypothetical protein
MDRHGRHLKIEEGAELDKQTRRLGAITLQLLNDRSWINRRVDKASFSDPVTLRKFRSVDFTIPLDAPPIRLEGDARNAHYPPLATVDKWRLANVDVRNESGAAIPLVHRRLHGPIAAAALVTLGSLVLGETAPVTTSMPREVQRDCRRIANARPESALNVCEGLQVVRPGEGPEIERWREALATSELFMGLAWELARSFLLMVPLFDSAGTRRLIKVNFDYRMYAPPRGPLRHSAVRRVPDHGTAAGIALVLLRSEREMRREGTTDPTPDDQVVWRVTEETDEPHPVSREYSTFGEELLISLTPGTWKIEQLSRPGFRVRDSPKTVTIAAGDFRRVVFENVEQLKRIPPDDPPVDLPGQSWFSYLSAEAGIRSRSLLINTRIGDGGSYHFEFEAPPGFVVTRAKISAPNPETGNDPVRGWFDISLPSSQRAHLYVPQMNRATQALVLINLRPRSDTNVDSSFMVALLTAATLVGYAWATRHTGPTSSLAATILLASPGALAAFASRAPDNPIVSRMTAGLRYFGLLPGVIAFVAAAMSVALAGTVEGTWTVRGCAAVAVVVACWWGAVAQLTRRPPEKRPDRQGEADTRGGEDVTTTASGAEGASERAYTLRQQLRVSAQGIPEPLRVEYFGADDNLAPGSFADGADPAPTFHGITKSDLADALDQAVRRIGEQVDADEARATERPAQEIANTDDPGA